MSSPGIPPAPDAGATPSDVVAAALAVYLGPRTARSAVRTIADGVFGRRADQITRAEAPRFVEAFRPMLRTLLGEAPAEALLRDLLEVLR